MNAEVPKTNSNVRDERRAQGREEIYLLRDRDFDFDPDPDVNIPSPVSDNGHKLMGWRWCRHEIENYLLEPDLVALALPQLVKTEFQKALTEAAKSILNYTAARWTIGYAKRKTHIPPYYSLRTKPHTLEGRELALPDDLSEAYVMRWLHDEAMLFRDKIDAVLLPKILNDNYYSYKTWLSKEVELDTYRLLHHFSGKDLFAALHNWLNNYQLDPGKLKGAVLNFIRNHPDKAIPLVPEWMELINIWKS